MIAPTGRSLMLTAVASVTALLLLIAAGVLVRQYVSRAFDAYQQTYEIKSLADSAIKLQLDEETGIRGMAATGDPEFLQPYTEAREPLNHVFARLESALHGP